MLTFSRLIRILTLVMLLTLAINPSVDSDSWWHLRAGQEILARGEILKTDPFSLTRQGEPWIYPGWLSQIALYQLFDTFSFGGLNVFTGIMIFVAFFFVWRLLQGRELLKAFMLLLAAATTSVYWSARPQIISFALTGITIYLLERAREGKVRSLWYLPLVMIVWVNVHGGFAIGFIFWGLYFASALIDFVAEVFERSSSPGELWERRKRYLTSLVLVGILSMLAVCINPNGPVMLLYPFKTLSIQALQNYIAEWQTPDFHGRETWPFLLMFFMTWISLALSQKKITSIDILLPLVVGYMSLTGARNIALYGLTILPILFRHSSSIVEKILSRRPPGKDFSENLIRVLNWTLLVLFLVAASLKIMRELSDQRNQERIAEQLPLEAFDKIENDRYEGNLFNSYNWGGYVVWRLYPNYLSFVDGRTDLFGDEILSRYFNIWLAESGWEEEIQQWGIAIVLVEPHAPIAHTLEGIGWVIQYEDSDSVLLTRPSK